MEPLPPSLIACPNSGRERRDPSGGRPIAALVGLLALCFADPAPAQKVRISNLSDVNFGTLTNLQADARQAQNVCLYSNSTGELYSITASGSGTGSAFLLSNGSASLPFEVEWSSQSGQSSGTSLAPNVAVTGQQSSATHQFCNTGPVTSASLILVLRSAALSQAREGNYSGTLTLIVAAE